MNILTFDVEEWYLEKILHLLVYLFYFDLNWIFEEQYLLHH